MCLGLRMPPLGWPPTLSDPGELDTAYWEGARTLQFTLNLPFVVESEVHPKGERLGHQPVVPLRGHGTFQKWGLAGRK